MAIIKTFAAAGSCLPADLNAITASAGLNEALVTRKGKSIIATTESRTNVAFGLMTTPDRVSSVVVPTDGILIVSFQAIWQSSVNGAGQAAIFIGANQAKENDRGAYLASAAVTAEAATDEHLATSPGTVSGLASGTSGGSGVPAGAPPATGVLMGTTQMLSAGGPVWIDSIAAGTYDISVQFLATSGSVTVRQRRLRVFTLDPS